MYTYVAISIERQPQRKSISQKKTAVADSEFIGNFVSVAAHLIFFS